MKFLGKSKVIAYIFYVIAILFCLYTLFSMVTTIQYLSSVVSSGMYAGVAFSDMLTAFVGQVGPYLFYTLVLFFCGYAIQMLAGEIKFNKETKTETETTSESLEPTSSYTGTLSTEPEADAQITEEVEGFVPVEEDNVVVEEEVEPVDDTDTETVVEDIPVVEDDADLTNSELEELEEGIEEFDKKEVD